MITLASDFGTPYPAAMKGVLGQRTAARVVDIAHDFPRQDVRTAAFWLREVLPYFPPATHLVVIDPGVGTERAALVLRAGDHTLVGPDNGVLCPTARRLAGGDDGELEAYVIDEDELRPVEPTIPSESNDHRSPRSKTFHGRDIFAPAAAAVHDAESDALGSLMCLESGSITVDLELPTADLAEHRAVGEVMVVDGFGNAITNVPGSFLDGRTRVLVNGDPVPAVETFAAVSAGARLATVGSHGYVELDVNRGRGEEAFGLAPGDRVVLEAPS